MSPAYRRQEIRNKFELSKFKYLNKKTFSQSKSALGCFVFLNLSGTGFENLNFDIVSPACWTGRDLGFRI